MKILQEGEEKKEGRIAAQQGKVSKNMVKIKVCDV